jgi:hypothetical protein
MDAPAASFAARGALQPSYPAGSFPEMTSIKIPMESDFSYNPPS